MGSGPNRDVHSIEQRIHRSRPDHRRADTGIQASHPALAGKIVAEGCYSTLAYGSSAGGCPNGSWTQTGAGAARYCSYSSSCSHGTHVAGTAAGSYGVARAAKIMPVQVFHRDAASGNALSYTSDQLWGLKHVYDRRNQYSIAAVNLSIGSGGYTAPCDDRTSSSSFYAWAAALRSVGIATVVAAGNDGYYNGLSSPACTKLWSASETRRWTRVATTPCTRGRIDPVFVAVCAWDAHLLLGAGEQV